MKERRTLVGGIGPLDRSAEKEFVFGGKAGTTPADGTRRVGASDSSRHRTRGGSRNATRAGRGHDGARPKASQ